MVKILVVEDDYSLNSSVCRYLSGCGYETSGAVNGVNALKLMEEKKFDLIVSDIMMPLMDGFEFAETVRAIDKLTPILFMTAKDDLPSKEKGFAAGIDDYLVKPFELTELKLRISALLRRAKIEQSKKIEIGSFLINEEEHTFCISFCRSPKRLFRARRLWRSSGATTARQLQGRSTSALRNSEKRFLTFPNLKFLPFTA